MESKLSLLPQRIDIDFNFRRGIGNLLIASSLVVLAMAEVAINNDDLDYWNIDERLNKHRSVRDFDSHVQKMLRSIDKVGDFQSIVQNSSSNNYHYVEFNEPKDGICIRILHTFNPNAKYMKKYLEMNRDSSNPKFAYIQYSLDRSKTQVRNVKVVIPCAEGFCYNSCNLFPAFATIKQYLGKFERNSINNMLKQLREETSISALPEKVNKVEKGVENNV